MATLVQSRDPRFPRQPGSGYPLDDNRGTWGILVTICTEATLFVCLFASYFYLANNKDRWAIDRASQADVRLHHACHPARQQRCHPLGRAPVKTRAASRGTHSAGHHDRHGPRLSTRSGSRVSGPLEEPHSLQRQLRLDLLHHHHFSRGARRRRLADAASIRSSCRDSLQRCARLIVPTTSLLSTGTSWILSGSSSSACSTSCRIFASMASEPHNTAGLEIRPTPPLVRPGHHSVAWFSLGLAEMFITWRACLHNEEFGNASSHPGRHDRRLHRHLPAYRPRRRGGFVSYLNWRRLSTQPSILQAEGRSRSEFVALLGVYISITLGVGMIWMGIPLFILRLCARVR